MKLKPKTHRMKKGTKLFPLRDNAGMFKDIQRLVRHHDVALPKSFAGHPAAKGVLHEGNLKVCYSGRLRCKVLVFKDKKSMALFWREGLGKSKRATAGAEGICSEMMFSIGNIEYVDPNYFAIIGLIKGRVHVEAVSHECTHAALFYEKRTKKKWPNQDECPGESICYPQGRLMRNMTVFLHRTKIWDQ